MEKKYAIGADIGGSHISSVVIDMELQELVENSIGHVKVNNKASSNEILNKWKECLQQSIETIDKTKLNGIGFAMPGPFDYENGIALFTNQNDKFGELNNVNVANELRNRLELPKDTPFRFMNDATSFAVGEAWIGKSAGYDKSIAITLGTGFGSAFIANGIPVLEGANIPKLGCVWHLQHKDGIADDYYSTRWFIKSYAHKTGKSLPGVKEIAEAAVTDKIAKELFEEFGSELGKFMSEWIQKFDAKCIVMGGNILGAYHLFGASLEKAFADNKINIKIQISELLETSAMIGSAKLMNNEFWEKIKPLLSKM